jgi:signal transduction histidine kinase
LQKDIELDDETQEVLLSSVIEETDRLASLITNLLNMSRLEAGVWKPEKERCHIADIIHEALERQRWVHKEHIFEAALEPYVPEVYADYSQIRQVLINLLENAAAHSEEGTRIIVRGRATDDKVEVNVSDQGVGIPQEDLGKIFDKFYRGTQKRGKPGGTGLGLAICQAIVQGHGGEIWAESELGHGSTFYFTLPVASAGTE